MTHDLMPSLSHLCKRAMRNKYPTKSFRSVRQWALAGLGIRCRFGPRYTVRKSENAPTSTLWVPRGTTTSAITATSTTCPHSLVVGVLGFGVTSITQCGFPLKRFFLTHVVKSSQSLISTLVIFLLYCSTGGILHGVPVYHSSMQQWMPIAEREILVATSGRNK